MVLFALFVTRILEQLAQFSNILRIMDCKPVSLRRENCQNALTLQILMKTCTKLIPTLWILVKTCTTDTVDSDENLYKADTIKSKENINHTPPPPLSLITKPTIPVCLTHRQTILASSDSLTADQATQEDKVMLAKLGRWIPLVYNHEEQQHGLLTSASTASILLQRKSTTGIWSIPTHDNSTKIAAEITSGYDHLIQHIKTTRQ